MTRGEGLPAGRPRRGLDLFRASPFAARRERFEIRNRASEKREDYASMPAERPENSFIAVLAEKTSNFVRLVIVVDG